RGLNLIPSKEREVHELLTHSTSTDNFELLISNHIKSVVERTNGKVHGPGGAAEILGIKESPPQAAGYYIQATQ
ncbi:MAG: hypothetical protein HOE30_19710, partial [Deltaproteobacteria bacterium]|nr:hypothetical protein [Deltaproteobacteria bacterium]